VRKNAQKYVELVCSRCQNKFQRKLKEYNYQVKLGQTKFYCFPECSKLNRTDEFTPFKESFRQAKKSAKYQKKEFNISIEDIRSLWESQKGICPYTGIQMELSCYKKHKLNSASLDRIDSSKGYINGNIEFVCLFINLGKNGFEKPDVKDFLKRIVTYRSLLRTSFFSPIG